MQIRKTIMTTALVAAWMLAPAAAEEKVIMKINGVTVTQADLDSAEAAFGASIAGQSVKQRQLRLVRHLINANLLATAAEADKLGDDPAHAPLKKYYARRALGDLYWLKKIRTAVTDADAMAAYNDAKIQVHARHILLKTEADAVDVIERLNRGEDFAALAKELSTGPSAKQGGDLGYFTKKQMVKAFAEVAFSLKKGEFTQAPVKTQFGWHVIKVEDIRKNAMPPFEDVKGQIMASLYENKYQVILGALMAKAKIEIIDEEIKKGLREEAARGSIGGQ